MAATRPAAGGSPTRPETGPSGFAAEGTPRGVWLLVGTIAAAKVTTLGVVLWSARTPEPGLLIGVTMPPWLLIAALLLAGPVLFRLRLRRVRARRDRLRREEWLLAEPVAGEKAHVRSRCRLAGPSAHPPFR